jgi:ribonuclease D
VGLGALTQSLLSLSLAKEHSAVDWSYRPLHPEWKNYAALDVDVLLEIYEKIKAILITDGKIDYAYQEFQSILEAATPPPRVDPWRRTSGMHQVKGRRAIAIVRELWLSRNELAQELDIAPGRILPDLAISEIAILISESLPDYDLQKFLKKGKELLNNSRHLKRRGKERSARWMSAIERALKMGEKDLPAMRAVSDSLPPIKAWADKAPLAYARLTHARFNLQELSVKLSIPMENLLLPETLRRITWASERKDFDESELVQLLSGLGARKWQIELTLDPLERALKEREPRPVEAAEGEEEIDLATSGPAPVGSDH